MDGDVVSLSRGNLGFAAFTAGDTDSTLTVDTGLRGGSYCDRAVENGSCTVDAASEGTAQITVPAYGGVVLVLED